MRSKRSPAEHRPGPSSRLTSPRTRGTWRRSLSSPHETDQLGRLIGSVLMGGESLALSGTLGAGKTALVRGIAAGLGAAAEAVSSPTFVLLHEYRGRLPLAHLDLYRIDSLRDAESIGLDDYLSGSTVVAVEWADKALALLPPDRLEMELRHRSVQSRSIQFRATGPLSAALLTRIKHSQGLSTKSPRSRRTESAKGKSSS
ncbi:MAG TPA: tRNA (adenosine(37)-N6)-threonylcarbamoyltransferase complex ATPase subunit type 1 TsaE [Nitrospira sp.]|nr:tRNA (adenosine(37)-N6)-threonylcarbamoyltransferase complex ATPase subunit type 1 TsaE [Nitrospira sp.]